MSRARPDQRLWGISRRIEDEASFCDDFMTVAVAICGLEHLHLFLVGLMQRRTFATIHQKSVSRALFRLLAGA